MANKRMFTKKICDSDAFLDMPLSTRCLYFHLNFEADDDGFVGNPKKVTRMIGASEDDLKLLIAKRFLLGFENGVIVIKHWRMHNALSANRYTPTQYIEEKEQLLIKENGAYSFNNGNTINDEKYIEMGKRQAKRELLEMKNNNRHVLDMSKTEQRRDIDTSKTDSDIDLDIDLDKDIDIYIKKIIKRNSLRLLRILF